MKVLKIDGGTGPNPWFGVDRRRKARRWGEPGWEMRAWAAKQVNRLPSSQGSDVPATENWRDDAVP